MSDEKPFLEILGELTLAQNDFLDNPARFRERTSQNQRDDLLNSEIFYNLNEAGIVIKRRRKHFNTIRPRSCNSLTTAPIQNNCRASYALR